MPRLLLATCCPLPPSVFKLFKLYWILNIEVREKIFGARFCCKLICRSIKILSGSSVKSQIFCPVFTLMNVAKMLASCFLLFPPPWHHLASWGQHHRSTPIKPSLLAPSVRGWKFVNKIQLQLLSTLAAMWWDGILSFNPRQLFLLAGWGGLRGVAK